MDNHVRGDFGKVYLGDDGHCNIIGKGDATIKLANGVPQKLIDVRHVPSLRKNLISVDKLATCGYATTFLGDSWKVTKGAMVVT